MPQLGVPELLIILVIIIAIFGAGKLANLGGALGKAVRDFRENVRANEEEFASPTAFTSSAPKPSATAAAEAEESAKAAPSNETPAEE
jgi:sec-independent protein translocase protein TatA